jgi:hypothetical protein
MPATGIEEINGQFQACIPVQNDNGKWMPMRAPRRKSKAFSEDDQEKLAKAYREDGYQGVKKLQGDMFSDEKIHKAEERERREAEEKSRREAEERERREAEEKSRLEAIENERREAEEKSRLEAIENERREAEEKSRLEAIENERREAEEKERRENQRRERRERALEVEKRFLCSCGGKLKYDGSYKLHEQLCHLCCLEYLEKPAMQLMKPGQFWICKEKKCKKMYCFDCKPKVNPNDLDREAVENLWDLISANMPGPKKKQAYKEKWCAHLDAICNGDNVDVPFEDFEHFSTVLGATGKASDKLSTTFQFPDSSNDDDSDEIGGGD